MREFSFSKKLALIAVIILVFVGASVYWYTTRDKTQAHMFRGSLQSVDGDLLKVTGHFYSDDGTQLFEETTAVVNISSETNIEKIVWHMPTKQELQASNNKWNPDTLRKTIEPGSVSDLKSDNVQGLPLEIKSEKNIFKKPKFNASYISFIEMSYPR